MEENKKIEKPVSLLRADFINSLTILINNSHLSPFIVEPILRDFLGEVQKAANNQYELDRQRYENELKQIEDSK